MQLRYQGAAHNVQLCSLADVWPHERTSINRVQDVAREFKDTGIFDFPLLLGRASYGGVELMIVADGHHRLMAAKTILGLSNIPAIIIDYLDDGQITVQPWRQCEKISKHDIIRAAAERNLMPIKSSRHRLKTPLSRCDIRLSALA